MAGTTGAAMLHVRVLQALSLEADGTPLPLPRSRRARSLLGWLVVHPGLHHRARLAERFWPDVPESTARNSLRQALWELRTALGPHGPHLVTTRDQAGVLPGPGLWVDHWEFASLVAGGRLEDALALERGTFLEDIDDEWAYEAREDDRCQLVEVLVRAAREAETAGDLTRAVAHSRRLVQLDPYNEEAHRQLMRRLAKDGDLAAAIAVPERLGDRLRRDLGLPLSRETRALAERLRAGATPVAAAPATPLPRPPADEPFVGRDAELARLQALLHLVAAGQRRIVLVEGDAGIGKTRLALELCQGAGAGGATVLFGRCTEENLVPYQPFVEALRRHVLAAPRDQLRAALPPDAGEVLTLLPEIEARVAVSTATSTGETGQAGAGDRFRLFEAVVGLLHRLSGTSPAVLVLDDLHWADRPSLLLLRHLARSPIEGPLLIVATYRGGELEGNDHLQAALADLPHQATERIRLEGLPTRGVAALVTRRTGQATSAELVGVIEKRTGGNPFFINEVLRNLTESGALTVRGEAPVWDLASRDAAIPEAVSSVLSRRITRLGELGRRVLETAAVVGDEFRGDVVAAVIGIGSDPLLDILDAAVRCRLLSEIETVPDHYAFAHPMVREVLYASLTANRRARLHEQVGLVLEAAEEARASSAELARHFLLAGTAATVHKAIAYSLQAAEDAMRQRAHEEAVTLFDHVLDRLSADDRARRRRVLSRRAVAHTAAIHSIIEPRRLPTAISRRGQEV